MPSSKLRSEAPDSCSRSQARQPAVSVVVPVLNAEQHINNCVNALLNQDYWQHNNAPVDIIVVDNGSTDGTRERLAGYGSRIRVLTEAQRGASAARNTGIGAARHPMIAFTDADCIPCSNWLSELMSHSLQHPQADFIGGPIRARPPSSELTRFVDTLFDQQRAIEVYQPPYMITANVLARKSFLQSVGLFNVAFLRSQDVELSFRSGLRHGARFEYAARAEVHHNHVDKLSGLFHKGLQHGAGAALIRREFLAELGPASGRRPLDPQPHLDILRHTGRLLLVMVKQRGSLPPNAPERYAFHNSLFRWGRQIGYAVTVFRQRHTPASASNAAEGDRTETNAR